MTKNSKYDATIKLLAVTTAVLLLVPIVAQTPVQLATAQEKPATQMNSKYYLQQYTITHQQLVQVIKETSDMEKQVAALKAENAPGNEEKIRELQQQIDRNKQKMQSLIAELDQIQEKSQALFRVDPATKKKLDDARTILYNMYMNKESPTYVGENPVREVGTNYEYKNLVVSFDPDQTINNPAGDKSKAIIAEMKKVAGDISLDVNYEKIEPVICTTRYQQCDPLVAGVAIKASSAVDPCTEGYKAFKGTAAGFVMAGHCGSLNDTVRQPPAGFGGSRQVGTITARDVVTCDCAFVTTSVNTGTWIFNDGNNFFVMYDKTPGIQQLLGTIVIKSGIGSGTVTGTIVDKGQNNDWVKVQMTSSGGDSGSPVFKSIDGTNVHMYGAVYQRQGTTYTWYYTVSHIASKLGLTG